jgi:hypothetical protein
MTQVDTMRESVALFEPTGMPTLGDGTNLTGFIPTPSELILTFNQQLGLLQIARKNEDNLPVSCARQGEATPADAANWLAYYKAATRQEQAKMLGVTDPYVIRAISSTASIPATTRVGAWAGRQPSQSAPKSKLAYTPQQGAGDIQVAATEGGRARRTNWRGHPVFALAKALGALGVTASEVAHIFYNHLQLTSCSRGTINGGVYAGRTGTRGAPANLSPADVTYLLSLRPALGQPTELSKATSTALQQPTVKQQVEAAIHQQAALSNPPAKRLTKLERAQAHDLKVAKELAKRKAAGARR